MSEVENEESWSAVEGAANVSEATLIVGFLENHQIPARMVDRSFHQTPTSGEGLSAIEIAVPTDRLDEARAALEKRERAYEATPHDESVLTDEGPREIDPQAEPDPESGEPGG